uniref:M42 family peptidase n=1 Tax=candidate division WOR-3 bacterium TaxID=2052148 RepID=A0A7C4Y5D1_UNCW3
MKEILEKLSNAAGPSGFEENVSSVLFEMLKEKVDEIKKDKVGNVIALKKAKGERKGSVMLTAHLDEIGMIVTAFDGSYIKFETLGGWDNRIFIGQKVIIFGKKVLKGVVGAIPPHYLRDKEKKVPSLEELFIDIGMNEKDVKKYVRIGDPIYIDTTFKVLNGDIVTGKALDNRASCAVICSILMNIKNEELKWDVYGVFTIQEESTSLGAYTSAFKIKPDFAIVLDVTHATSFGVGEDRAYPFNKGPGIAIGPNIHNGLFNELKETAKRNEIPYFIEPIPGQTGTDASAIQVVDEGIPTALLSVPIRYMHTPTEVLHMNDLKRTERLIISFLREFDGVKEEVIDVHK